MAFAACSASSPRCYIRLVHATSRWTIISEAAPRAYWDEGRPFIVAFWHGRLAMMPYCWRTKMPLNMLISKHRDGALIAGTIAHFGVKSVRGSAGDAAKGGAKRAKGGVAAMRAMAKLARTGEAVGITPDGPRGPRMRADATALRRLRGSPAFLSFPPLTRPAIAACFRAGTVSCSLCRSRAR